MSENLGKFLAMLEIPEVSNVYQSIIRRLQPAELVKLLEGEKVSTRGHMPELRCRLLRLEVRKSQPLIDVPWYPEDDVQTTTEDNVQESKFEESVNYLKDVQDPDKVITPKDLQNIENFRLIDTALMVKTSSRKRLENRSKTTQTENDMELATIIKDGEENFAW